MKTRYIFAALAATLLLAGCFQDVHELDPSRNVGFVAPELSWANPADAGTDIHDLLVAVNSEGGAYTKHYTNVRDFAREPLEAPAGECGILVLANATEADGIRVSGLSATKWTPAELLVNFAIISILSGKGIHASPDLLFGACTAPVRTNALCAPDIKMCRILPALDLMVTGIPEGATVRVSMDNMASAVVLSAGTGAVVLPGAEPLAPVSLKTFTTSDNTLSGAIHPTVEGAETCNMTLDITLSAGSVSRRAAVSAPRIDCGNKYSLKIDFNDLVALLELDSDMTIVDWTTASPIDGEAQDED